MQSFLCRQLLICVNTRKEFRGEINSPRKWVNPCLVSLGGNSLKTTTQTRKIFFFSLKFFFAQSHKARLSSFFRSWLCIPCLRKSFMIWVEFHVLLLLLLVSFRRLLTPDFIINNKTHDITQWNRKVVRFDVLIRKCILQWMNA